MQPHTPTMPEKKLLIQKKAEVSAPVWRGAEPGVENPETPEVDPYEAYLTGAMGSESRRGSLTNLMTGTRWKGPRGIAEKVFEGLGEGGAMVSAGVKPWAKDFDKRMSEGMHKALDGGLSVDRLFGRRMRPMEAITALGITGLPGASAMASDPMTWARAFGNAAKTPLERVKARKSLHAALSLRELKTSFGFDPKKLQLAWAGIPERTQKQFRMEGTTRDTPQGPRQLPAVKDIMNAPVLNPMYFPDTERAADLMAKMSSDDQHSKIAGDLQGGSRVAKFPKDPEDHLYHIEKRDGKTVGMVKVAPKDKGTRYHITNFWVKPGLRSQGIGGALFKRLIGLYGDKELTLDSEVFDKSPLNQKALDSFYEKHDFVKGEGPRMSRAAGGAQEKAADAELEKISADKEALFRAIGQKALALGQGAKRLAKTTTTNAGIVGLGAKRALRGKPNALKDTWNILNGNAARTLGWRQRQINDIRRGIPAEQQNVDGAQDALLRVRGPKARGHIIRNLEGNRELAENSQWLNQQLSWAQNRDIKHLSRLDPRLKQFEIPGELPPNILRGGSARSYSWSGAPRAPVRAEF